MSSYRFPPKEVTGCPSTFVEMVELAILGNAEEIMNYLSPSPTFESVLEYQRHLFASLYCEIKAEFQAYKSGRTRVLRDSVFHEADGSKPFPYLTGTHAVLKMLQHDKFVVRVRLANRPPVFGVIYCYEAKNVRIYLPEQCTSQDFNFAVNSDCTMELIQSSNEMSEYMKQWEAIRTLSEMHATQLLTGGVQLLVINEETECENSSTKPLNKSQFSAVESFVKLSRGVQMLEGPPGTGKTFTIVDIIEKLHVNDEILVAAQTNKALHVIAERLIEKNIIFVLMGSVAKTPSHLQQFLFSGSKQRNMFKKHCVVLSTLSGCFKNAMRERKIRFTALIVDEAGLATEPAILQAIALGPKKILLVGDIKQLKPMSHQSPHLLISSKYNRSLMERFAAIGMPLPRLDVNYRNDPAIFALPNDICYGGTVTSEVERTLLKNEGFILEPLQFIDVKGVEQDYEGKGLSNTAESTVVLELVKMITQKPGVKISSDVVVVSPYKGQVALLTAKLAAADLYGDCIGPENIATADSVQGRENKIYIVSLVRTDGVGFLSEAGRMNVLTTRAQDCVIFVGDRVNLARSDPESFIHRLITHTSPTTKSSLSECYIMPMAKHLLAECPYNSTDYFANIPMSKECLGRLKKYSASCQSSTIDLKFVSDHVFDLCGVTLPDKVLLLISSFYTQKYEKFFLALESDELAPVVEIHPALNLLKAEAYARHFSASDGGEKAIGIYRQLSDDNTVAPAVRSLARAYVAGPAVEVNESCNTTREYLLRASVCGAEKSAVIRDLNKIIFISTSTKLNAGNFNDVYSAHCRLGHMNCDNIEVATKHFENAMELESIYSFKNNAWHLEKLAALSLSAGNCERAEQLATQALYRNGANINAMRIRGEARNQILV